MRRNFSPIRLQEREKSHIFFSVAEGTEQENKVFSQNKFSDSALGESLILQIFHHLI